MVLLYIYSISLFRALGNSFRTTYRLSGKLNYPNGIVCGEDQRYSRVGETGEILVHMPVYDALDLRERIDQLCGLELYLVGSYQGGSVFTVYHKVRTVSIGGEREEVGQISSREKLGAVSFSAEQKTRGK